MIDLYFNIIFEESFCKSRKVQISGLVQINAKKPVVMQY